MFCVKLITSEVCEDVGLWPLELFSGINQQEGLPPLKVLVKRELRGTSKKFRVSVTYIKVQ